MLTNLNEFLEQLPSMTGIFLLMFSTFLLGYFGALLLLKKKYRSLSDKLKKEINELRSQTEGKKEDIDTLFSEIKPRIIEVVKQTQEFRPEPNQNTTAPVQILKEETVSRDKFEEEEEEEEEKESAAAPPETVAQKARATFIKYNIEKPELNFDSIGYADHDQKDDLTRIMGIGPYIEQKLNEIGICNYEQISRLSEADIQVVTELIDFFPGRIERDNWVGQAKALKVTWYELTDARLGTYPFLFCRLSYHRDRCIPAFR